MAHDMTIDTHGGLFARATSSCLRFAWSFRIIVEYIMLRSQCALIVVMQPHPHAPVFPSKLLKDTAPHFHSVHHIHSADQTFFIILMKDQRQLRNLDRAYELNGCCLKGILRISTYHFNLLSGPPVGEIVLVS